MGFRGSVAILAQALLEWLRFAASCGDGMVRRGAGLAQGVQVGGALAASQVDGLGAAKLVAAAVQAAIFAKASPKQLNAVA